MDLPEKYYKGREILEWDIETEEGDWVFVCEFDYVKGPAGEVVLIYSFDECDRLGISVTECPCVVTQYNCDLQFKVEDGFVKVTNKNALLFMMQRRLIKNIVTKIDDVEI